MNTSTFIKSYYFISTENTLNIIFAFILYSILMKALSKTYSFIKSTFLNLLKKSLRINGVISSLRKKTCPIQLLSLIQLKRKKQMFIITKKKIIVYYLVNRIFGKRKCNTFWRKCQTCFRIYSRFCYSFI